MDIYNKIIKNYVYISVVVVILIILVIINVLINKDNVDLDETNLNFLLIENPLFIPNSELNEFNKKSKNIAIMLESRIFPNTEFILRQFSKYLPTDFTVRLYITLDVLVDYNFIVNKLNNNIEVELLNYKLESVKDYNNIMLDVVFWKSLRKYDKVLIFQSDTMIYKNNINDFLIYDYIGAPWNKVKNISNGVGNGGLSIRTIEAMIDCLENYDDIIIPETYNPYEIIVKFDNKHPEDVFYSYGMTQLGYNVADIETASKFSIENYMFNEDVMGSHQLYKFNIDLYKKLLLRTVFSAKKNNIIPMNIYQTWYTTNLPTHMKKCVEQLKNNNPEFNHYLYDDNECLKFIKENYDDEVVNAYNSLVPGAYKADLWRYCILYINGGIYIDIKFECINEFKFISLLDKEYIVLDRKVGWYNKGWHNIQKGIYNGLMICKPKNKLLFEMIKTIINNIKNNFYGLNSLNPTGPILYGITYEKYNKLINNYELTYAENGIHILYNKVPILKIYNKYRDEQKSYQKTRHYGVLWDNKHIYL
jgi:mannosyltransferase OCH1-like enzyme